MPNQPVMTMQNTPQPIQNPNNFTPQTATNVPMSPGPYGAQSNTPTGPVTTVSPPGPNSVSPSGGQSSVRMSFAGVNDLSTAIPGGGIQPTMGDDVTNQQQQVANQQENLQLNQAIGLHMQKMTQQQQEQQVMMQQMMGQQVMEEQVKKLMGMPQNSLYIADSQEMAMSPDQQTINNTGQMYVANQTVMEGGLNGGAQYVGVQQVASDRSMEITYQQGAAS
jgi:hypothetical protein